MLEHCVAVFIYGEVGLLKLSLGETQVLGDALGVRIVDKGWNAFAAIFHSA